MHTEILSDETVSHVTPDLASVLMDIEKRLQAAQVFLQFLKGTPSGSAQLAPPPSGLWRNAANLRMLNVPPGQKSLCRTAIETNRILVWPFDPKTANTYARADDRVGSEMVGPIRINKRIVGVLLVDRLTLQPAFDGRTVPVFLRWIHQVQKRLLRALRYDRKDMFYTLARACCRRTLSARGYIALKRWDGGLDYFVAGDDSQKFLPLAMPEGICGRVLMNGKGENIPDVLADEDYVPSDSAIQSEIVWPIVLPGQTVGVVNMESFRQQAYTRHDEKTIQRVALLAARYARFRRYDPEPGLTLAVARLEEKERLIRANRQYDIAIDTFLEYLTEEATTGALAEVAGRALVWRPDREREVPPSWPPLEMWTKLSGSFDWSPSGSYQDEKTYLWASVLADGETISKLMIETRRRVGTEDRKKLRTLCKVAGDVVRRLAEDYRRHLQAVITTLLIEEDHAERLLDEAVRVIPEMMRSDHCTLLFRISVNGDHRFVPGPTTTKRMHITGGGFGYGASAKDGLTGYVIATGRTLNIRNIADKDELQRIDSDLQWKSRLSEDIRARGRSLLATAIFDHDKQTDVIGVLRMHRDHGSKRPGFTPDEVERFEGLAKLISKPLTKWINANDADAG